MKPGILHAWLASATEVGSGVLLLLGLLTPLAAAGAVGVMVVAWITNHLHNGFFIFRPGEGWEYVMTLTVIGVVGGDDRTGRMVARRGVRHPRRPDRRHRFAPGSDPRGRRSGRAAARILAPATADLTRLANAAGRRHGVGNELVDQPTQSVGERHRRWRR